MARVGHQINRGGSPREPGPHDRHHIAHGHHQIKLAPSPPQLNHLAGQVHQLAFPDLEQLAAHARVAEAAGADGVGFAHQRHIPLPVGLAMAHQGHGHNRDPLGDQLGGQEGAAEVFSVAVAEQQNPHRQDPRLAGELKPASPSP